MLAVTMQCVAGGKMKWGVPVGLADSLQLKCTDQYRNPCPFPIVATPPQLGPSFDGSKIEVVPDRALTPQIRHQDNVCKLYNFVFRGALTENEFSFSWGEFHIECKHMQPMPGLPRTLR